MPCPCTSAFVKVSPIPRFAVAFAKRVSAISGRSVAKRAPAINAASARLKPGKSSWKPSTARRSGPPPACYQPPEIPNPSFRSNEARWLPRRKTLSQPVTLPRLLAIPMTSWKASLPHGGSPSHSRSINPREIPRHRPNTPGSSAPPSVKFKPNPQGTHHAVTQRDLGGRPHGEGAQ